MRMEFPYFSTYRRFTQVIFSVLYHLLWLMLMQILLVFFSDIWESDTATLHLLTSLKMNGKISLKEWIERVRMPSVRMKDWKRSFVFGHHIGDRHWQELVGSIHCGSVCILLRNILCIVIIYFCDHYCCLHSKRDDVLPKSFGASGFSWYGPRWWYFK